MRIEGFSAEPDLLGRRVLVAWDFVLDEGEGAADIPEVAVRRKLRDFSFPPVDAGHVVYDSATFPPAPGPATRVVDLPGDERHDGAEVVRRQAITVADVIAGRNSERLRRSLASRYDAGRALVRQHVELIDAGTAADPLVPLTTYYYELLAPALAPPPSAEDYRDTAAPGQAYGLNRTLYDLLPEIYRRHDTITPPARTGDDVVPELTRRGGQLRRFVDVFGCAADSIRSSAEGLWTLHDALQVDRRYLPLLAQWIGWDLSFDVEIPQQRNEIRNAPRLYEAVGSLPGLRSVVDHYTGWTSRVSEFVQHVLLSSHPAAGNAHWAVAVGAGWSGGDDARVVLGFGPGNDEDTGAVGVAASITGAAEPYALRPGMRLEVAVDGALAAGIVFGEADFADMAAATAAEVAAVVDREMWELDADVSAGAVRLTSRRSGPLSRLQVAAAPASPLALDGVPGGRLATFGDAAGRVWVIHAEEGPDGGRLSAKAFVHSGWRDGHAVDPDARVPGNHPAACPLPDGRIWLSWVERPDTPASRPRWRLGTPRPATPATLRGLSREPFDLTPGTTMTLTGYGATEVFVVNGGDYVDPAQATAAEVANAINAQLAGVSAAPQGDGSLALQTAATGPGVDLYIDLATSTTARVLGFGDRRLRGRGGWDDRVDWEPAGEVPTVAAGRHADGAAVVDPGGGVRLFWSVHVGRRWRLARARWDGRVRVATTTGVGVRDPGGAWSIVAAADGLPADDVRAVATDAEGTVWFATAAGAARRHPDGTVEVLDNATTLGGLADDDVRAVAVAGDGAVWFGHAAGVSGRRPDGTWATIDAGSGLADDDVRGLAVSEDGTLWVATAAGLSTRPPDGAVATLTTAGGLPSDDLRGVARHGRDLWLATAAGLVRVTASGAVSVIDAPGLASSDVRAVVVTPAGVTWAATAAGVVERAPGGGLRAHTTADGLPTDDCRSVALGDSGRPMVGTAAGLAELQAGGGWRVTASGEGLAGDTVQGLWGGWSAPALFAPGGGGDREPHAAVEVGTDRIWLAWAERQGFATAEGTWLLRARRLAWPAVDWSPPLALTALPPAGRFSDREPALVLDGGGGAQVHFRSDRDGGPRVWSMTIDAADTVTPAIQVTHTTAADTHPAVVAGADGNDWLLFRSDRSIALGAFGGIPVHPAGGDSWRAPEAGSVRRYAGALTPVLTDLPRNRQQFEFGDLAAYTPQRPRGPADAPLRPDEVYTRGTIGLHVQPGPTGRPLTTDAADRVRQLLRRFLPVNIRAAIIIRTPVLVEEVYGGAVDLQDRHLDSYPFVDVYAGLTDASGAALPDWFLFLATDAGSNTADAADLTTLRRRTWWSPPG